MTAPTVGAQIAERFMPGGDAATREHLRAAIDAALSVQADAALLDAARDFEWFGRIEIQPGQRGLAQTHDKMRTALEAQAAQSAVAWQPIDSAPRDGTVIELRWGEDGQMPGWWLEAAAEDSYQWAFFDTGCDKRTFVNQAVAGEYGPSHWRPYRPQPVAVAGEAVRALPADVQQMVAKDDAAWALAKMAESFGAERDEDDSSTWWVLRIDHFRALAQDRASQAGAAGGVP